MERRRNQTGGEVDANLNLHLEIRAQVAVVLIRLELLDAGRQGKHQIAKAKFRDIESGPIEVGTQLVRNDDLLGWGRGVGFVFKVNAICQRAGGGNETVGTVAGRASHLVGVCSLGDTGCAVNDSSRWKCR